MLLQCEIYGEDNNHASRIYINLDDENITFRKTMISFSAKILRYEQQGEKTGWTYIEIPDGIPQQLKPGNKKEFKVKGTLDHYRFQRMPLYPVGSGKFIMSLNADVRKAIGKRHGATITVQLSVDESAFVYNADFMECLNDEPKALDHFRSLPGSHQRYFSKWIDSAKTEPTKAKRIAMAVNALSRKWGYGEMIRAGKGRKDSYS